MRRHPETAIPEAAADPRRCLATPLIVQRIREESDHPTFFGYAKNISRGGLFISATNPKEVGSRFCLEIPLPEPLERTLRCTCEVVWHRLWSSRSRLEPGMGIRFLDLSAEDGQAVDRWVRTPGRRVISWGEDARIVR